MKTTFRLICLAVISIVDVYAQSAQDNNASLKAKIELGQRLFYDADLSINGTMSCATCHEQKNAFADGNKVHPGALGDQGKRNVPGLANVSQFKNLTWAHDHLSGLAEQSLLPIRGTEPIEMGMHGYEEELPKRLGQNECYQKLFSRAFAEENGMINLRTISQALESFEKTLVSDDSIYDQAIKNNTPLPTKEAQEGKALFFGAAQCSSCHSAPLFSDDAFHQVQSLEVQSDTQTTDFGLFDVTKKAQDKYIFRTPSLRNASLTSPYWHDGSAPTLKEAIRKHHVKNIETLSAEDISRLIAFIDTLTDISFTTNPDFAKPEKSCND